MPLRGDAEIGEAPRLRGDKRALGSVWVLGVPEERVALVTPPPHASAGVCAAAATAAARHLGGGGGGAAA